MLLEGTGSEHEGCYETFKKHSRNSGTQNLIILRNFQYWPKALSFLLKNTCTCVFIVAPVGLSLAFPVQVSVRFKHGKTETARRKGRQKQQKRHRYGLYIPTYQRGIPREKTGHRRTASFAFKTNINIIVNISRYFSNLNKPQTGQKRQTENSTITSHLNPRRKNENCR